MSVGAAPEPEPATAPAASEPAGGNFVPVCKPEDLPKGAATRAPRSICSCRVPGVPMLRLRCQCVRHPERGASRGRGRAALLVPLADLRHRVAVRLGCHTALSSDATSSLSFAAQPLWLAPRSPAEGAYSEGFLKAMLTQVGCCPPTSTAPAHLHCTASKLRRALVC